MVALASAFVRVRADTSGVKDETKREFEGAGFEAGGSFASAFRKRLKVAFESLPKVKVNADTTPAEMQLGKLRADLEALSKKEIGVDITSAAAMAKLEAIKKELEAIKKSGKTPVDVRVDAAKALAELALVNREVDKLDGKKVDIKTSKQTTDGFKNAFSGANLLTVAIGALGPAIVPAAAAVTAGTLTMGASFLAAGAGSALFAVLAKQSFKEVTAAQKQYAAAVKQYDAATTAKGRQAALAKEKAALDQLTPTERQMAQELTKVSGAWEKMSHAMQPAILAALLPWVGALLQAMKFVPLLVLPAAHAIQDLGVRAKAALGDPFWKTFFTQLGGAGGAALQAFGIAIGNVVKGLAGLIGAILPFQGPVLAGIVHLSQSFAQFGTSAKGTDMIRHFFDYVRSILPNLANAFRNLGPALKNIVLGVGQLGGSSLLGWQGLVTILGKLSPNAISALVIGITAFKVATMGAAVATQAWGVATTIWENRAKIAKVATALWAGVQWVLDAAMNANPIGLVVIAVAALAAGIYLAWKHSATFRSITIAAWNGIKVAALFTWNNVLKPIWIGIQLYIKIVIAYYKMWWEVSKIVWAGLSAAGIWTWNVLKAVWAGIMLAVKLAWETTLRPIFNLIVTILRTYLAIAFIWFSNIFKAVWIAIQIQMKITWGLIKIIFDVMRAYVMNVLAPVFTWLWQSVIIPVWDGIKAATVTLAGVFTWLWRSVVVPVMNGIRIAVQVWWLGVRTVWETVRSYLGGVFTSAWNIMAAVISTVWHTIQSVISSVWSGGIKPIFNAIGTAIDGIKRGFQIAVDAIRSIWNGLRDAVKGPVNFVIGIYDDGIVRLINGIASLAGIGTRLSTIPQFAGGGVLPGYAPGVDSIMAAVSPGEAIMVPEFTRGVGSSWVHMANRIARRFGPQSLRNWLGGGGSELGGEGAAFAAGGVAGGRGAVGRFAGHFDLGGIIGGALSAIKNFTIGNLDSFVTNTLGGILNVSVPGSGLAHDAIAGIPGWIKTTIVKWVKDHIFGGSGNFQGALNFAMAQSGKPYVWGGVGPDGYDCSGFMSAITNVIRGKSPYSRLYTTHDFGGASAASGFVQGMRSAFQVGVTNAGVGHMAGTLLGTNVESNGSQGVHYGPGARGFNDPLFGDWYGLKAALGAVVPGMGASPVAPATAPSMVIPPQRPSINVTVSGVPDVPGDKQIASALDRVLTMHSGYWG